jgi:hypothetical protein
MGVMNNNYTKSEIARVSEGDANKPLTHRFRMTPKTLLTTLAATAILVAAASINTHAQTWETVMDLEDGLWATAARAVLVDPFSTASAPSQLFGGGQLGFQLQFTRLDQVSGQHSILDAQVFADEPTRRLEMGYDPSSGDLYSAQFTDKGWLVRRSPDRGLSWANSDLFEEAIDPCWPGGVPDGIAADGAGNVYVCGQIRIGCNVRRWVVRKTSDRGHTWATVHDLQNASGKGIHFVPGAEGGLFTIGTKAANNDYDWLVRRSRDGGATWVTVDVRSAATDGPEVVTSDRAGRIYVAGTYKRQWTVRQSDNGGAGKQSIQPGLSRPSPLLWKGSRRMLWGTSI